MSEATPQNTAPPNIQPPQNPPPTTPIPTTPPKSGQWWRVIVPLAIAALISVLPPPPGLAQHAWYYFAIFAGTIAGLMFEPLPNAAVALIGVTTAVLLAKWTLFDAAELAAPNFSVVTASIKWGLAGFANTTVWLVGFAFMFALGYKKTGLGRRIALLLVRSLGRNTLALGYATTLSDAILAPITPSNTARSAGTIYPIVVNLPALYGSKPHDPSARKIGGYIMWTTFAASCITSSLFMTAAAPNFLALEFIRKIVHVRIDYLQWMTASAPWAFPLLLALPVLVYWIYPPTITRSPEVPKWAAGEIKKMGRMTAHEIVLSVLVLMAIILWVVGADYIDAATTALFVVAMMLITGIFTWDDMAKNHSAWTTIVLLACLVTMADGLGQSGFIKWFAALVGSHIGGLSPIVMILILVSVYFFSHYMFASLTAHTTTMMPVVLAVGMGIKGLPLDKFALALAMTTGIMGVMTPYATGAALPYYNSGYITTPEFWRLGTTFGFIFLAALLGIGVPLLML